MHVLKLLAAGALLAAISANAAPAVDVTSADRTLATNTSVPVAALR
jgi:hypothetical protein